MTFRGRLVFGLGIIFVTFVGSLGVQAQVFAPAKVFSSGGTMPKGVATGDFNGDGNIDFAVVNQDNTVGVRLGDGKGGFGSLHTYSVNEGTFLSAIAVGDFNEDGKLDLVVGVANANNGVALLLGNGDGTFQPPVFILSEISLLTIAVADLNHDGHLDLFLGGNGASAVLLGNGNGTFRAPNFISTGGASATIGVAIGDINHDGIPDLVGTNLTNNTVGVLLGNGDGTFQPAQVFSVGLGGCCAYPDAVALGDFNGDGKLDIAVGDFGDNVLNILLGNGDGTFQPAVFYFGGSGIGSLQAADVNADGILDLIATSFSGDGVTISLGNGDGTFTFGPDFATGLSPGSVVVADFTHSQAPDLAVTDFASNDVAILINQRGQRGFYSVTDLGSLEGAIGGSLASDINDQGAVAATSLSPTGGEEAFLWLNGQRLPLTTLGGKFSVTQALNRTQVVGQANLPGDTFGHATLWNAGLVKDLGTLGGNRSVALGINNGGQIVGQADTGGSTGYGTPVSHAFLKLNTQSTLQDLGTLGGDNSSAFAINHLEQAVGQSDITTTPDPTFGIPAFHGFVWQNWAMQDLGQLFGGNFNVAQDLNGRGQVVGSADLTNDQVAHAFLWQSGSVRDLGSLPGNTANMPTGINNAGQVVGNSGLSGASFFVGPPVNQFFCPCHTILWKNGQVIDLQTQLPGNSPWLLLSVSAINDQGEIVGTGLFHNEVRAFLLTPGGAQQDSTEGNVHPVRGRRVVRMIRDGKALRLKMQPQ
jgi:probable HAF family extracellular repeat protein